APCGRPPCKPSIVELQGDIRPTRPDATRSSRNAADRRPPTHIPPLRDGCLVALRSLERGDDLRSPAAVRACRAAREADPRTRDPTPHASAIGPHRHGGHPECESRPPIDARRARADRDPQPRLRPLERDGNREDIRRTVVRVGFREGRNRYEACSGGGEPEVVAKEEATG